MFFIVPLFQLLPLSAIFRSLPPSLPPVSSLEGEDTESKLRGVFVECREVVSEVIINDLAGYRQKRVIGMAGMFGDHMVTSKSTARYVYPHSWPPQAFSSRLQPGNEAKIRGHARTHTHTYMYLHPCRSRPIDQMTIVKQLEVVHAMLLPDLRQCM